MSNISNEPEISRNFQIIFEKLEEAKKDNQSLFEIKPAGLSLSDSIKGIKEIVDSYSSVQQYTTITRV